MSRLVTAVICQDFVVDGGWERRESERAWLGRESQMGDMATRWGESKTQATVKLYSFSQTFKSGSCKNPLLQYVCYWYNLLR